jgi:predicted MFS family arabinose efflux permease
VIGALLFLLWGLLWVWFPTSQPESSASFVAHFQAVGGKAALWCVLAANGLQVMAFIGMSSYLAAYVMHTYHQSAGATALPLTVAGLGVIAGSLVGGRVDGQAARAAVVALAFGGVGSGPPWCSRRTSRRGSRSCWPVASPACCPCPGQ